MVKFQYDFIFRNNIIKYFTSGPYYKYYPKCMYEYNYIDDWITDTGHAQVPPNSSNIVADITYNSITIHKFKPNKLLACWNRLVDTDRLCSEAKYMCNIKVKNIEKHIDSTHNYYVTSTTTGAGNDVGKLKGLCYYPYSEDGEFMTVHLNYWNHKGIDKNGEETLPQIPDMSLTQPYGISGNPFRIDGEGRNQYGIFKEHKEVINCFPYDLYGFDNTQGYSYTIGFGIFTGNQLPLDENGLYDCGENPIQIILIPPSGENQYIYCGGFSLGTDFYTLPNKNIEDIVPMEITTVNDKYKIYKFKDTGFLQDFRFNNINTVYFRGEQNKLIVREDDYTHILLPPRCISRDGIYEIFSNTKYSAYELKYILKNSQIIGRVRINIDNKTLLGEPIYYMTAIDMLYGTNITGITINIEDGSKFSVGQNMFRNAKYLESIELNSTIGGRDCSGMFEFCNNLREYDSTLINWGDRAEYEDSGYLVNHIPFCFEYSGLLEIPQYNQGDRFADNNTIISSPYIAQAFNGSNNLKYIGPVIDLKLVNPNTSADRVFACNNLQDARIKNLNHGNWYLDGSGTGVQYHGNLINLNLESVQYLFDNLYDLKQYGDENSTDLSTPKVKEASLYCPSSWGGLDKYDFRKMTVSQAISVTSNTIIGNRRQSTTTSGIDSFCYITNSPQVTFMFQIEGLVGGDTLGIGAGTFSNVANKYTENGIYQITIRGTWGFKLYNDDTSIKSNVTITSVTDQKVTNQMIQAAHKKGWNIYIGGNYINPES